MPIALHALYACAHNVLCGLIYVAHQYAFMALPFMRWHAWLMPMPHAPHDEHPLLDLPIISEVCHD